MMQVRAVTGALPASRMYLMVCNRASRPTEASKRAGFAVIRNMLDHLHPNPTPTHRAGLEGIDTVLSLRPLVLLVLDPVGTCIEGAVWIHNQKVPLALSTPTLSRLTMEHASNRSCNCIVGNEGSAGF
jgi:hypothetical protein